MTPITEEQFYTDIENISNDRDINSDLMDLVHFIKHSNYRYIEASDLSNVIAASIKFRNGKYFQEAFAALKDHDNYGKIGVHHDWYHNNINGGLQDLIKISIEANNGSRFQEVFEALKGHDNYRNIKVPDLCDIIKTSIRNNGCGFEELIRHPKFNDLSREQVAHLMEASIQASMQGGYYLKKDMSILQISCRDIDQCFLQKNCIK